MRRYFFELWSKHNTALIAWGAVLLSVLLMFALGIDCPIKFLTGISCAGCGMTRACISAIRLDFFSAFDYHPLWIALPFAGFFLVFFKIKKKDKAFYSLLLASVAVMVAVYVVRLLFTDSDVVVFVPESGAIYRCLQEFTEFLSSK